MRNSMRAREYARGVMRLAISKKPSITSMPREKSMSRKNRGTERGTDHRTSTRPSEDNIGESESHRACKQHEQPIVLHKPEVRTYFVRSLS